MVLRTILETTIQWDRIPLTNASARVLLLLGVGVVVILIIVIDEGEVILIGEEVHGLILQKIIVIAEIGVRVST